MFYGFLIFVIIASLFLGFFGARYIDTTEHKDKSQYEKRKDIKKEIKPATNDIDKINDSIDKRNDRIDALKQVGKELSGNTE